MMDSAELIETDITNLQAPTFTTLSRGPPEPITRLKWDHKVNLIGQKVLNPMIHICEKCNKPILIYGRLIPCRHVFCLTCAKEEDKVCMRCKEGINRVEQALVGNVFMCTHGGTKYGQDGCRRTYLSGRDLQAHMNHRHLKNQPAPAPQAPQVPQTLVISSATKDIATMKELYLQQQRLVNAPDLQHRHEGRMVEGRASHEGRGAVEGRHHTDPRTQHDARRLLPPQVSPQPVPQSAASINQIPVLTTRNPNLVTVPIQESPSPSLAAPPLRFPPGYQPSQAVGGFNFPPGQGPPQNQQHFRPPPPSPFYPPQQPRYPPNFQGQAPVGYDQNPQFRPAGQPWPGQQQYYR